MAKIQRIISRQVLDSRGNPTVEVDVITEQGSIGRAAVPSGASTGTREALELRDGDKTRFLGKGVLKAVKNIEKTIAPALLGMEASEQKKIDTLMLELDGTENKEKLGANAILAVSMAACRAAALDCNLSLFRYLEQKLAIPNDNNGRPCLPAPLMNIINGGEHASNNLDIQEFMIVPHIKSSFSENLRAGVEVFHQLKKVLSEKNYSTNVGDEGGFAPNLQSHEEAIECILVAMERAGYRPGEDISLSFDAAASEFYSRDKNSYRIEGREYSSEEMIDYYHKIVDRYPVYSIEDGLDESDYASWTKLTERLGSRVLTVGDDLFVTNKKVLERGIQEKQANAILIKVNQIGSLSETFETLELAYQNGIKSIISHRSGETGDSFIADLAVASGAGHIKTGSASRSDRMEKYNQLLRIEEELQGQGIFHLVK